MRHNSLKVFGTIGLIILLLAAAGCGVRVPVSFEVPVDLVKNFELSAYEDLPGGVPIPADIELPEWPVCTLPTEEQIMEMVEERAGEFVSGALQIEGITLVNIHVSASSGSFDTLTAVALAWVPSEGEGEIPLGSAVSDAGLQSDILFEPPAEVDVLALTAAESMSKSGACPGIALDIEGVVPETIPVFSATATVRVEGSVGL